MYLFTIFLTTLLTLLSLASAAPQQDQIIFLLKNNCNFPVYVREAVAKYPSPRPWEVCQRWGETKEVKLPAHYTAYGAMTVLKDSCGHSFKVSRTPSGPPYQFEYTWALENDRMWYDMSHEDGNPFTDIEREFATNVDCPVLKCNAGNDGRACDYAIQADCASKGKLHGWLCGRGKDAAEDWEEELRGAKAVGELEVVGKEGME